MNYHSNTNITVNVDSRSSHRSPNYRGVINPNSMEFKALRQDFPRQYNGLYYNGWRTGYYHYNQHWNDNYFWYPHYCSTPFFGVDFVISPWYSYSFLPGYLTCDHIIVSNYRGYWGWNVGFVYINDSHSSYYQRNQDLDYALDDLQDGFEKRDFRALERVIPDDGRVAIFRDGRYDYSISADDFDDLIHDLSSNADTDRYRILETRTSRDSARISAVHEYTDQWGNRQRVYHSIYLQEEHGRMVIREFGTSDYRVW
ncbi:MAG: hypothetical protein JST12_08415 [Armatimonadetes bacterium]|nr:hypothetical protein [Armatimonadota bacterium]MBS1701670.1 hypothetical protein [Armatimonadota bacterium]MBS1727265.1 hypothetical protein [Armatimonadota bacterium]